MINDVFQTLKSAGFVPCGADNVYYKRCDVFQIIVSHEMFSPYCFTFELFINGTRYRRQCKIDWRLLEYDLYYHSIERILHSIDCGEMGSVLINALIEHQMTDQESIFLIDQYPITEC